MSSGGGGSTSTGTNYTSDLPQWVKADHLELIERAGAQAYADYTPYQGERVSGLSNEFQNVQNTMGGAFSQTGGFQNFDDPANSLYSGIQQAYGSQYNPGTIGNQYAAGSPYDVFQYQGTGGYQGIGGYQGADQYQRMDQYQGVGGYQGIGSYQGANPYEGAGQYQGAGQYTGVGGYQGPQGYQQAGQYQGQNFGQQMWNNDVANHYMSPYDTQVADYLKEGAIGDFQSQEKYRDAEAVQAGAFGGGRAAIMEAEAESSLMDRLGGIDSEQRQRSYDNAQSQFERDRTARMGGLTATEQSGQFGYEGGLSDRRYAYDTASDAARFGYSSAEDVARYGHGAYEDAARYGYDTSEDQRRFGYTSMEDQSRFGYGAAQDDARFGYTSAEDVARFGYQSFDDQSRYAYDTSEDQSRFGYTSAEDQSRFGYQSLEDEGRYGFTSLEDSRQFAFQQDEAAAQFAAQYGLSVDLTNEELLQKAAEMGLDATQLGIAGSAQLGDMYAQANQGQLSNLDYYNQLGSQEQAQGQFERDIAYEDFLRQQGYDQSQISWMSGILGGSTTPASTYQTTSSPAPSMMQQISGLGVAGLGAYSAYQGGE